MSTGQCDPESGASSAYLRPNPTDHPLFAMCGLLLIEQSGTCQAKLCPDLRTISGGRNESQGLKLLPTTGTSLGQ